MRAIPVKDPCHLGLPKILALAHTAVSRDWGSCGRSYRVPFKSFQVPFGLI